MMATIKGKRKTGMSMIPPKSFYSCESEKTKHNWFCYELSMAIYDEMQGNIGRQLDKYKISNKDLAGFSIYASKVQKCIILQKLSGTISVVTISFEMIESYFPNFSDEMVNKVLDVISETWDMQLSLRGLSHSMHKRKRCALHHVQPIESLNLV
jgi:hypothetical protein